MMAGSGRSREGGWTRSAGRGVAWGLVAWVVLGACDGRPHASRVALEEALQTARVWHPDGVGEEETWARRIKTEIKIIAVGDGARDGLELHYDMQLDGKMKAWQERRIWRQASAADPQALRTSYEQVESLWRDGAYVWRRQGGPWIERETLDGGMEARWEEALGAVEQLWGIFEPYLTVTPLGTVKVLGKEATRYRLERDAQVVPAILSEEARQALRRHVQTEALWLTHLWVPKGVRGEVTRTKEGEILSADWQWVGGLEEGDQVREYKIEVKRSTEALEASWPPSWPKEALPAGRERPWLMVRDVLGDALLDPYRR